MALVEEVTLGLRLTFYFAKKSGMQHYFTKFVFSIFFTLMIATTLQAQYCMPSSNCSVGDGIREFGIAGFLNVTECEADDGIAGYGDFTDLAAIELGQGVPYTVVLRSGFSNQEMSIWIDADDSESFETDELILIDEPVGTEQVFAEALIPADMPMGTHRLRVQAAYFAPSSEDACVQGTFGETEDYTVTIGPPPACLPVSGLTLDGVGATTAQISWTENGDATAWDIEFGVAGFAPTGMPNPGYDDVTNPGMISGLVPTTTFEAYVRADCGMDNENVSTWTGPITFTTLCAEFVPPYYEGFATITPDCWDEFGGGTLAEGPIDVGFDDWFSWGFGNNGETNGAYRLSLFFSFANNWLISPIFDLTSGDPYQVEFDFALTANGIPEATNLDIDDEVHFLVSTDNGSTWTDLQVWTSEDNVNPAGEKIIIDLADYEGEMVQFAFYGTTGEIDEFIFSDVFVDNFYVRVPPTCIEVSGITAINVTGESAVILWTENGDAGVWDLEFGPAGFVPTGEPSPGYDDIANPALLNNLDAVTAYDVYIRADCGDDDVSLWIGPLTFTTGCTAFEPPYQEDFTLPEPDCWEKADNGDYTTGPEGFGFSSWFSDGFANDGFSGAQKINLFTLGKNDWLISPIIDGTNGGPYQVEFDVAITLFSSPSPGVMGSDDEVRFLISIDNGDNWETLEIWDNTTMLPDTGQHYVIDLADYAGQNMIFAFWGTEGEVDDVEDVDFFVDNFEVVDGPNALDATAEVLNINCSGDGDGRIELDVTGGDPPYQFEWSNGDVTSLIFDLPAGEYTCTITDGLGNMIIFGPYIIGAEQLGTTITVEDETAINANDGSIDLEVDGGNEPYTYFWSNGATTQDLENLAAGEYCVTITDVNNCETVECVTVSSPVSNYEITGLSRFDVYPNPVRNEWLQVNFAFANTKQVRLSVLNTLGQTMTIQEFDGVSDVSHRLNLSDLPKGIYFVQLMDVNSKQLVTRRIVKQ